MTNSYAEWSDNDDMILIVNYQCLLNWMIKWNWNESSTITDISINIITSDTTTSSTTPVPVVLVLGRVLSMPTFACILLL